jgi:predicted AAA+ superfamily ATPase
MVKDVNLETLKGSCRAYVLDGLTHFIEICIRNSKRSVGKIVCNKVISELPPNYQKPFQYKLTKIDFIENPDKYDNDSSKIDEKLALSDLGIKLQQALKK